MLEKTSILNGRLFEMLVFIANTFDFCILTALNFAIFGEWGANKKVIFSGLKNLETLVKQS